MTRLTLGPAFMTAACVTQALAQASSAPRNDLPQPERHVKK
jgi:hypothetical protein